MHSSRSWNRRVVIEVPSIVASHSNTVSPRRTSSSHPSMNHLETLYSLPRVILWTDAIISTSELICTMLVRLISLKPHRVESPRMDFHSWKVRVRSTSANALKKDEPDYQGDSKETCLGNTNSSSESNSSQVISKTNGSSGDPLRWNSPDSSASENIVRKTVDAWESLALESR